uniref:Uncharacterized protein n=1 Tax=Chromera velia CCMP2878 TaxID=1169474 RepID=A0A0G4I4V2_9ALVE|mmetsp:Transcript_24392/g.47911  ORF Transcript_24392/g.47911 Transcript_24392/m.47911 type:complete len:139 (+) Transcript_24392:227-643(+)|eukprot:Cvel_10980.t1-p1 / transcript=Cvel_10980.t1 / gene=Cvel_10980 / organism=Chromera_velia_CCMP2878 / gene_product=hypothetical protein / transcript_product=hypothetical protein / location=Cvel_scaffold675:64049-64462(+) / protein_length=138 / sequence_SO=supercontig / SO=protein_coding / is_pseudo=false
MGQVVSFVGNLLQKIWNGIVWVADYAYKALKSFFESVCKLVERITGLQLISTTASKKIEVKCKDGGKATLDGNKLTVEGPLEMKVTEFKNDFDLAFLKTSPDGNGRVDIDLDKLSSAMEKAKELDTSLGEVQEAAASA